MNSQYPIDQSRAAYVGQLNESPSDRITDPAQAVRALKRHIFLFIAVALATFLAVAVYTFQATPIYTTSASVIIDAREKNVVDFGSVLSGLPPEAAVVDTEVEIIRSRSLARKVVKELNLKQYPEFNPTLREPGFIGSAKAYVRSLIRPGQASADEGGSSGPSETTEMDMVISSLLNKTSAHRINTTYGIAISASSQDPELAADIANAIVDQYLVEQLDAKLDATRRANAWLEDRLSELREEVSTAEQAVEEFRNSSGLLTTGETSLSEQQIGDLNAQLIQQRAELAEAEARLSTLRELAEQGTTAEVSGEALNSGVIADLRRQQAEITREKADLLNRYGPKHPDVERINTEQANIQEQISTELDRIVTNLEGEVSIARRRVASLRQSIAQAGSTLAQNNRASVKLRELERDAEASRSIYEAFLSRFKQTNEQEGLAEPDARVLSSAAVPQGPSFPKTSLNLVLGLGLGCLLGVGAVIASETFATQISSGEEIEERFKLPFLGNVPKVPPKYRRNARQYLLNNPTSAFAESFRNLRASIIFADLDSTVKTVAVTSSQPDEGKTTVTQSLGLMAAMSGTKTIVVDGDFRRNKLSEISIEMSPERGFLECLFGECEIEDAVIVDEKTGLHVLPLTPDRHTPRDVFGSRAFDNLMEQLKEQYEFVIFDTGPLLLLAETRVLASKVDQVVVVSRWLKTSRAALKQTLSILKEFRANIVGVILNQVDAAKYHSHGYGHSGYKAYRKYYT